MESSMCPNTALAFSVWILLQLLHASYTTYLTPDFEEEGDNTKQLDSIIQGMDNPIHDPFDHMSTVLYNFRLWTSFNILGDDLGFWVKPRSTTWFSQFLINQYDDIRWVEIFRMTKSTVFALANVLSPRIQKKDTKYRLAIPALIPALIRVSCTLFKLAHGANLFICSELFAIGKSTVSMVLREVVNAINDTLRHEITWPSAVQMEETQAKFADLCGLPSVVGAIDGMHVSISKPQHVPTDYYYFKSGGYTMNCQAIVDSDKRFLDLFVGMPGSTNDSRMLRRSSLYNLAMHGNLFDAQESMHGFTPYLVGDQGYPLLPWLMVPHRTQGQLSCAEVLFNRRLKRGRCVVENAFGILKQTFRELLGKSELNVTFLPDVIIACAILHNILLGQSHTEVEQLLQVLHNEGLYGEVVDDILGPEEMGDFVPENMATTLGSEKRVQLGVFLAMQRQHVQ